MAKNTVTVEYPMFIRWTRTLDQWTTFAQGSGHKQATQLIWDGDTQDPLHWIEQGHNAMFLAQCSHEAAAKLMDLCRSGWIDPEKVSQQLAAQNWAYEMYSNEEEDQGIEHFLLNESWNAALGNAMMLTRTLLPWCEELPAWFDGGLELFAVDENHQDDANDGVWVSTALVDETHESSLRELCEALPWVREAVASRLLDDDRFPQWPWVFDESLGVAPSKTFIELWLRVLDESPACHNRVRLTCLAQGAPVLYDFLNRARELYLALYGGRPDDWSEEMRYTEDRTNIVFGMLMNRTAAYTNEESIEIAVSTSPSMDKLFCTDAPSSAA